MIKPDGFTLGIIGLGVLMLISAVVVVMQQLTRERNFEESCRADDGQVVSYNPLICVKGDVVVRVVRG